MLRFFFYWLFKGSPKFFKDFLSPLSYIHVQAIITSLISLPWKQYQYQKIFPMNTIKCLAYSQGAHDPSVGNCWFIWIRFVNFPSKRWWTSCSYFQNRTIKQCIFSINSYRVCKHQSFADTNGSDWAAIYVS